MHAYDGQPKYTTNERIGIIKKYPFAREPSGSPPARADPPHNFEFIYGQPASPQVDRESYPGHASLCPIKRQKQLSEQRREYTFKVTLERLVVSQEMLPESLCRVPHALQYLMQA